jgi:hypothetical protein
VSVPAPKLDPIGPFQSIDPIETPAPSPAPASAARPPRVTLPHASRRARRGSPLAFWILVGLVASALILGIASMSALLVQLSFQVDDLRGEQATLAQQHEVLDEQVAEASSPERIMEWAAIRGMQMPERVVILRLPAASEDAG